MINAVLLNPNDSVVVVTQEVSKEETISFRDMEGNTITLQVVMDIPCYHKAAIKDIQKGHNVLKYGEIIGKASKDIRRGEHVHEHNLESANMSKARKEDEN